MSKRNEKDIAKEWVWGNEVYSPVTDEPMLVPTCPTCGDVTYSKPRCPFCNQLLKDPITREQTIKSVVKMGDCIAVVNLFGKDYKLFIQKCSDGLYSVDFGGRLGDIDAVVDLLNRLDLKRLED